jgi:uncharacterized protein
MYCTVKTLSIIIIALLTLTLLSFPILGFYAVHAFCFPKAKSEAEVIRLCTEEYKVYDREWFDSLDFSPFTVSSPRGYDLNGVYLEGKGTRTIVLCHGHTMTWEAQIKYIPLLIEEGWNIIAYNHRYFGNTGGDFCSAGFYEKQDLKLICDWAFEHFPETEKFGIQGESMGAATVLQYLPMDDRLDFVWADCPYSSFRDILNYHIEKVGLPSFTCKPILFFGNLYLKKHMGFDIDEVSPKNAIMEKPVPLFLIHGTTDTYVPTSMSEEMYEARKDYAPTTLLLIDGAEHARAYQTNEEKYRKELKVFLDTWAK